MKKTRSCGACRNFSKQLDREGRKALLIVDEAQNLSARRWKSCACCPISRSATRRRARSSWSASRNSATTLAHPDLEQLRQRVIASYHLGSMSREECGLYLTHRLKQVGWANDPVFQEDAIDAIFMHTGGIPRRINTLCSRLLLLGFLDNLHVFTEQDVARVAADLREENGARSVPRRKRPRTAIICERLNRGKAPALLGAHRHDRADGSITRKNRCGASPSALPKSCSDLTGVDVIEQPAQATAMARIGSQRDPASVIAGWCERPAVTAGGAAANALTIDVEDYFQVEAFFGVIDRDDWDGYDCRVERNIDASWSFWRERAARATFFTLGWIAERYPAVVRKIVEARP